jgi:hypothetical protein
MKKSRIVLLVGSVLLIVGYLNMTSQSTGQTKNSAKIKSGSVVISDTEYDLSNWTAQIKLDSNGATHSYNQQLSGGNPGSYLQIIYNLPLPPSSQISSITVLYKYTGDYYLPSMQGMIDSITYREDLRHEQPDGFVLSFPVVYQSGKIYRANNFSLQFSEPNIWHTGIKTGLVQNSFINIDGSGTRPNFSTTGDTIHFGFERSRTRSSFQIDPTFNTFIHGSDNFTVEINPLPGNRPPVAVNDLMVIKTEGGIGGVSTISPMRNDYDPDGDPIWIDSVFGFLNCFASLVPEDSTFVTVSISDIDGEFYYRITDGNLSDIAKVTVLADCGCSIECIGTLDESNKINRSTIQQDTLELGLIRRFRDEVMEPSYHGSRYVDMYYETTPEILYILLIEEPGLAAQAVTMVELLQPAIRNILDGDGTEPITQTQTNAIESFFANLSAAGSTSLQELIDEEMQRLGPLENYIGMPISDVIFQTMVTNVEDEQHKVPTQFGLEQNYPNPFNPSTSIQYQVSSISQVSLKVYDLLGREVAELVNEEKPAGTYEVTFDASGLSSGVYYYQIKTDSYLETKKMLLIR